jgi:hypothetical protein
VITTINLFVVMIRQQPITSIRDLLKSNLSLVFINFAYSWVGSRAASIARKQ